MDRWAFIWRIQSCWQTNGQEAHTMDSAPWSHIRLWFEDVSLGDDWTPLTEMMDPSFTLDIDLFHLGCWGYWWWCRALWWFDDGGVDHTTRESILMMIWGALMMIHDLLWWGVTFHHASPFDDEMWPRGPCTLINHDVTLLWHPTLTRATLEGKFWCISMFYYCLRLFWGSTMTYPTCIMEILCFRVFLGL
jgi:hypothetical protein